LLFSVLRLLSLIRGRTGADSYSLLPSGDLTSFKEFTNGLVSGE